MKHSEKVLLHPGSGEDQKCKESAGSRTAHSILEVLNKPLNSRGLEVYGSIFEDGLIQMGPELLAQIYDCYAAEQTTLQTKILEVGLTVGGINNLFFGQHGHNGSNGF